MLPVKTARIEPIKKSADLFPVFPVWSTLFGLSFDFDFRLWDRRRLLKLPSVMIVVVVATVVGFVSPLPLPTLLPLLTTLVDVFSLEWLLPILESAQKRNHSWGQSTFCSRRDSNPDLFRRKFLSKTGWFSHFRIKFERWRYFLSKWINLEPLRSLCIEIWTW